MASNVRATITGPSEFSDVVDVPIGLIDGLLSWTIWVESSAAVTDAIKSGTFISIQQRAPGENNQYDATDAQPWIVFEQYSVASTSPQWYASGEYVGLTSNAQFCGTRQVRIGVLSGHWGTDQADVKVLITTRAKNY